MESYIISFIIYCSTGALSLAIYTAMEEKAETKARYKRAREAMLQRVIDMRNGV